MVIALVNTNRMKPAIAPIGLEYVAEALHAAGHDVGVLDLCWEDDWAGAAARFFFDPAKPDRNYNYNANERLVAAIREGYRGAYWDILRPCG